MLSRKSFIILAFLMLSTLFVLWQLASAQPATAQGTVRFVVTGDTRGGDNGVNTTILSEIVLATIDEDADFILITGDLVNGSSSQSELEAQLTTWQTTMAPLYNAGIGVYPCRGNHDVGSKAAWDNVFSGMYALPYNGPSGEENITFSFTYGNVFIVGLDNYVTPHRVNQTWLDEQFTLNSAPHIFLFGHEPAFKVLHSDCLDNYPNDRNTFWNSIAAEGGRIYFAGHDHFYDHARLDDGDGDPNDDLHHYIVATGGANFYSDGLYDGDNGLWTPQRIHHEAQYGYVLVVVDGLNVTLTQKRRTAQGVYEPGDEFSFTVSNTVSYKLGYQRQVAGGGWHTVGLKNDGTLVAVGANGAGQRNISNWTDITQVAAGRRHTLGLKSNRNVLAVGSNTYGQCNANIWSDIVKVAAGDHHTLGLKINGTVVAVGSNDDGQCNVSGWTDVVEVAAGAYHTVALKRDGRVVAVGANGNGQCDVGGWTDIVQVAAGGWHTVGLKNDGTLIAAGANDVSQCDVSSWTDIVHVAAGRRHTLGLKSNGTVVAVGGDDDGQCNVGGWTDIVQVAAGRYHTVGLKIDGTVVAVGSNGFGQCDVGSWNLKVNPDPEEYWTPGRIRDAVPIPMPNPGEGSPGPP